MPPNKSHRHPPPGVPSTRSSIPLPPPSPPAPPACCHGRPPDIDLSGAAFQLAIVLGSIAIGGYVDRTKQCAPSCGSLSLPRFPPPGETCLDSVCFFSSTPMLRCKAIHPRTHAHSAECPTPRVTARRKSRWKGVGVTSPPPSVLLNV